MPAKIVNNFLYDCSARRRNFSSSLYAYMRKKNAPTCASIIYMIQEWCEWLRRCDLVKVSLFFLIHIYNIIILMMIHHLHSFERALKNKHKFTFFNFIHSVWKWDEVFCLQFNFVFFCLHNLYVLLMLHCINVHSNNSRWVFIAFKIVVYTY